MKTKQTVSFALSKDIIHYINYLAKKLGASKSYALGYIVKEYIKMEVKQSYVKEENE